MALFEKVNDKIEEVIRAEELKKPEVGEIFEELCDMTMGYKFGDVEIVNFFIPHIKNKKDYRGLIYQSIVDLIRYEYDNYEVVEKELVPYLEKEVIDYFEEIIRKEEVFRVC